MFFFRVKDATITFLTNKLFVRLQPKQINIIYGSNKMYKQKILISNCRFNTINNLFIAVVKKELLVRVVINLAKDYTD